MTIFHEFSGIKQVLLMIAAVALVWCAARNVEQACLRHSLRSLRSLHRLYNQLRRLPLSW